MSTDAYKQFETIASTYIATYDEATAMLTPVNHPLKHIICAEGIHIDVFTTGGDAIFGSWNQIPIRLVIIGERNKDAVLVEVFPAQTKTVPHATDFKRLADLATDGFWEWYPSLSYEYMSERFWSILGYCQEDMVESPDAWVEKIDPEDAKNAMANFEEHSKSKRGRSVLLDSQVQTQGWTHRPYCLPRIC